MKFQILSLAMFFGFVAALFSPMRAQAQAGDGGARLAFLSAEDRAHLFKVHSEVLASNPDLKTEQESLLKERKFVKDKGDNATPEDRKTLWNNFMAHNEKMEAAMRKADPTVAPILDQVDAKIQELIKQRAAQHDDGSSS